MGYIESVKEYVCGVIKAVMCEIIEQKKLSNDLKSLESKCVI